MLTVISDQGDAGDWKAVTIFAPSTLRQLARSVFPEVQEVKSITVVEFASAADLRGNSKREKIAEVSLSRATAKSLNLETVKMRNFPRLIDRAWQKPGLSFLVDDE